MRVIPPVTITQAMLTSSTIAEPDAGETAWVSGTTYAIGDVRIRTSTHRQYRRATAGAGTTPPESDATNWQDIGPTNRYNMLDRNRSTRSSSASPLTVVITPGVRFDSLGLCGMVNVDSAAITITNGASTLYTKTLTLKSRAGGSFFNYFFGGFTRKSLAVLFGLPLNAGNVLTITFTASSGNVQVGAVILGLSQYVGKAVYGASDSALNYSNVTRSTIDGTATFNSVANIPANKFSLLVEKQHLNNCRALREKLNGVIALYVGLETDGDDYFEALTKLGFARSWTNFIEYPTHYKAEMEIEEL